ncbi:ABC transporter ATP-binding protein [Mesomycoplasma molare]|uniref:ATP-binding cassette domain-containing protein n=1 Tax=Mesomycoplasma molare TaxID=171288 RepID=A0ABY5TVB9_9BACT|nr:ABC transporter ATP-binding protein [Mesomycoplasma molare]UWD34180.1 ATP-binding cassette domain-containing protein [Mesomycoplasma molare]
MQSQKEYNDMNVKTLIENIKKTSDIRHQEKKKINAIEIKDLVIDYGETLAVDNANIQIKKGELVTLLGPSGCGKTTTLNAIAGLLTPTSGQILFEGIDVTKYTPQERKIGLVFQNYALYPHLNVYDNIAFPLTNDKNWKIKVVEKSTKAQHDANLIVFTKNGATKEEIENFNHLLFNFFDVYKEINLEINSLESNIYKKISELKTELELVTIKKQTEIKKVTEKVLNYFKNEKNKEKIKEIKLEYKQNIKEIKEKFNKQKIELKEAIKLEKNNIKNSNELKEIKKLKKNKNLVFKTTKKEYYDFQNDLIKKYTLNQDKLSEEELLKYKELSSQNISVKQAIEKSVLEVANKVEIVKNLHKKPTKLSGGQQQRVAIARGIVREPKIILMDEPLSNLDAKLRVQTRQWIKKIQSELGLTTIFVTHDQEEAMSISDKIVCMSFGKIQQIGSPIELYNKPNNEFVAKFLGIPEMTIFDGFIKDQHIFASNGNPVVHIGKNVNLNKVRVGIRAEHLHENANGALKGKIIALEYLGKEIFAKVKVENLATFNIFLKHKIKYEINEEIKFNIPASKIHLFDPETKERIELSDVQ